MQHELQHMILHIELGDDYHKYSKAAHEFAVYRRMKNSFLWKEMSGPEQRNAFEQTFLNGGPDPSLWYDLGGG